MMSRTSFLFLASFLAIFAHRTADASPIVGPVAGSTTAGTSFALSNAFNQSGLSANYVSGVTDFATFTATTTHNSQPGNDYVSTTTSGAVTFDLGSVMTVDKLAFWNFGGLGGNTSFGVTQFTLVASTDAGFSTPINLGTFSPSVFSTLNPAQIFSFAPTSAEFFRLQSISSNGASAFGIGEVAFEASSVPEPSTLALFGSVIGLGIGGFYWNRRRRAAAAA